MQVTINIPDNLPSAIVQQYIHNIEEQLSLLAKLANESNVMAKNKSTRFEKLLQIANECAALPILDSRSAEEILGYDNNPLGLFGE
jgi:hypothetical protein